MKLENTLIMSGVYMVMSPNSQALGLFVKILTVSLICSYSEIAMLAMFSLNFKI